MIIICDTNELLFILKLSKFLRCRDFLKLLLICYWNKNRYYAVQSFIIIWCALINLAFSVSCRIKIYKWIILNSLPLTTAIINADSFLYNFKNCSYINTISSIIVFTHLYAHILKHSMFYVMFYCIKWVYSMNISGFVLFCIIDLSIALNINATNQAPLFFILIETWYLFCTANWSIIDPI